MSEIKVSFAGLQGARDSVVATVGRLTGQLEELRRYLAPLTAQWTGQAAEEYAVLQRRWDSAAADLTAVLAQTGTALGAAEEGYRQVELANTRRWA